MQTRTHPLRGAAPGTQRQIVSFHYGPAGRGRKAHVQASLHADELPGMLVAHHLRQRLLALEQQGRLLGEVVVVPVANPIGLAQSLLRSNVGRYDLGSGDNFNRHYPALFGAVRDRVEGRLGADAEGNVAIVREALRAAVAALSDDTELASQRKVLMGLACDADVVLDLHCDCESLVHLYTGTKLWPQAEALARLLGAQAVLLAQESGDDPFDEACSQVWWQLAEHVDGRHPVPLSCLAVTVELRGLDAVSHPLAARDSGAIIDFLVHRGLVDGPAVALPPLPQPATPLAGTDVLIAPSSGLVVHLRQLGERLCRGDAIAELIDPLSGAVCTLTTRTDGILFAREHQRFAPAGRSIAKVAGAVPIRSGKLTSE